MCVAIAQCSYACMGSVLTPPSRCHHFIQCTWGPQALHALQQPADLLRYDVAGMLHRRVNREMPPSESEDEEDEDWRR